MHLGRMVYIHQCEPKSCAESMFEPAWFILRKQILPVYSLQWTDISCRCAENVKTETDTACCSIWNRRTFLLRSVCVCHQWLWKRPDQFSGLIEDSFKDRQLPPDLINWPADQTDRRFTAKHIHNVHHQPRIVSDGRQSAKTAQRKRPPVETFELISSPSSGNSAQKFQNHLPTNMR